VFHVEDPGFVHRRAPGCVRVRRRRGRDGYTFESATDVAPHRPARGLLSGTIQIAARELARVPQATRPRS
jgi:hypothetical protein